MDIKERRGKRIERLSLGYESRISKSSEKE
jgi:hypothetical protein